MNFDDLRDRISELLQNLWSRIQENSTYLSLSERYHSLSRTSQLSIIGGIAAIIVLIIFSIPMSWYIASVDNEAEFDAKKSLIQEMFSAKSERSQLAHIGRTLSGDSIAMAIKNMLPTLRLAPEQIGDVNSFDNKSSEYPLQKVPQVIEQSGAIAVFKKLNLKQIVDIGTQLQQSLPSIKMTGLDVSATNEDPRYYNVTYKLVQFSIPEEPEPQTEAKNSKTGKKLGPKAFPKKTDTDEEDMAIPERETSSTKGLSPSKNKKARDHEKVTHE